MNMEQYLKYIYLALRAAPPSDATVRGIAATRRLLWDAVGEERHRDLITEWNALQIDEPPDLRFLAAKGIGALWVEAGLSAEMATRLNHLYITMIDEFFGNGETVTDLQNRRAECLASTPPDYSKARIIGNKVLAIQMMRGEVQDLRATAVRNLDILAAWREAEPDLGRDYEDEELRWVIEHVDDFNVWSHRFRNRLGHCRL